MQGLEAAPPEATAAIAGFHVFPFGGLRKARNWLAEALEAAPKALQPLASAVQPNP
jgi:methylenetetrahydrofolate reductase (NADPH)